MFSIGCKIGIQIHPNFDRNDGMLNNILPNSTILITDSLKQPRSLRLDHIIGLLITTILRQTIKLPWILLKQLHLILINSKQRKHDHMQNTVMSGCHAFRLMFDVKDDDPHEGSYKGLIGD